MSPTENQTIQPLEDLRERFRRIRSRTVSLCASLSNEDMVVQITEEASPAKWHLAHTTWFFETFVLERFESNFRPYDASFRYLFNSYYHQVGERHPRDRRGLLTRPGRGEIEAYRQVVDDRILRLFERASQEQLARIAPLCELGLQHEQQHQELLLTDLKLLFAASPLDPVYREGGEDAPSPATTLDWVGIEGGLVEIGRATPPDSDDFAYDNEGARHRVFLEPFELASRPVTNREYIEFIEDEGYRSSTLWLDDGWTDRNREGWELPLYWRDEGGGRFSEFTLSGRRDIDLDAPVAHVSFYEAEAYARWRGARLPTEAEWEAAATPHWDDAEEQANFAESGRFRPGGHAASSSGFERLAGDVWEWTRSAYEPYPGYAPPAGAVGEYNGKFMSGTMVLRGGSCATPAGHARSTYRNFFRPGARWQFSGIRLARGGEPRRS